MSVLPRSLLRNIAKLLVGSKKLHTQIPTTSPKAQVNVGVSPDRLENVWPRGVGSGGAVCSELSCRGA